MMCLYGVVVTQLKIWAKSFLKSTKLNSKFILRVIIPELQNNLTSKYNAHKLIFNFFSFFGVFVETLSRYEFFSASETVGERCDLPRDSTSQWIS